MNHDNQSQEEHPVDTLLSEALREAVPAEAERRLLDKIDTFSPSQHRWRFPLVIGGALAACLAAALVLSSMPAQPAYAWEQMQANLAKPTKTVQFWLTHKYMKGPENDQKLGFHGQAFARIKAEKGSRLDVFDFAAGRNMDRTPDKITFKRPDGLEITVNYKDQMLDGIRSYTYPPRKSTKPKTLSAADPFIKQLISTDGAILEGKELIDGRRTLRYSVPADKIIGKTKDAKGDAEVIVWVDVEHSLPVKWRTRLWSTDEQDPWETTFTFEDYVRDEPIDDSVFDLPPETVLWDRTETWQVYLTPDAELEGPLRIRVGLDDGTILMTEEDFDGSGDSRDVKDWDKMRRLTSEHHGETMQVFLNNHLVVEHVIDWPINRIQVLGVSYWLE